MQKGAHMAVFMSECLFFHFIQNTDSLPHICVSLRDTAVDSAMALFESVFVGEAKTMWQVILCAKCELLYINALLYKSNITQAAPDHCGLVDVCSI